MRGLNIINAPLTCGQQPAAPFGETRLEHAAELRMRGALDETGGLEVVDDAVHGLGSHRRSAGQLGVLSRGDSVRIASTAYCGVVTPRSRSVASGERHGNPR